MTLRPRQQRILEYIESYLGENDYPPTIREIGAAADISSTSVVNYNLEKLEAMGYIERNREVSRGLRLVGYAGKHKAREVPLYGYIAAGDPIPVLDDPTSAINNIAVPSDMLPRTGETFALEVKGHSMIDALVDDGDIVIVRSQPKVETGEMAVAEILDPPEEAGATLKRFYLQGNQVELRPANPDPSYRSFWLHSSQVRVHGKVVSVLRKFE
ncbi:MAG: repressor LexA [Chloroflexi bacterium]|nr:repressor LexA [Chloroflexota bacterium]